MRKFFLLALFGFVIAGIALAQDDRQFSVEDQKACQSVKLCLKSTSGNCFIKPGQGTELLNVFSSQGITLFDQLFSQEIKDSQCNLQLELEEMEMETDGWGELISSKLFTGNDGNDHGFWKVYLADHKPYTLELDYGIGNANVDLSGLKVQKLQINAGSANVAVAYHIQNQMDMDSLMVKADMGTVSVKNINLSRARFVQADIGFGNMILDFSEKPLVANVVNGSVGAGNLIIILPHLNIPMLVKINESWFCSVSFPKGFLKIGENTFASPAYVKEGNALLTFDLDVSMGHLIFKTSP